MNKEARKVNGKYQFLLGKKNGELYWLEQASFDCEWYWGLGYVESYRGRGRGDKSWSGHQHFNGLFFNGPSDCKTMFDRFFEETPFTDNEIWQILELMQSAYTCRRYSDMLHMGGSHITSRVKVDLIKNDAEYGRLNNAVIPTIMNEVYKLMLPKNEDGEIYGPYSLDDILHELGKYTKWGDEEDD